jgi:hypothetical protein
MIEIRPESFIMSNDQSLEAVSGSSFVVVGQYPASHPPCLFDIQTLPNNPLAPIVSALHEYWRDEASDTVPTQF